MPHYRGSVSWNMSMGCPGMVMVCGSVGFMPGILAGKLCGGERFAFPMLGCGLRMRPQLFEMINSNVRSQIDALWNAFWTGGISNPLEVIEQITYLLFLKRLDDLHTLEENKSMRLKKPMERRIFPRGKDPKGRAYEDFRWSRFKHFEAKEMFAVVNDHVFPFLRTLGGDNSTYAHHMKEI